MNLPICNPRIELLNHPRYSTPYRDTLPLIVRTLLFLPLLSAMFFTSCSQTVNSPEVSRPKSIQELYVAAREVDAAIATGATFDQYARQVTVVEAKLLIAQDSQYKDEKLKILLAKYSDLVDKYKAALFVWSLRIQNGRGDDPRLIRIQQRYGITIDPIRNADENLFEYVRDELWKKSAADEEKIVPLLLSHNVNS